MSFPQVHGVVAGAYLILATLGIVSDKFTLYEGMTLQLLAWIVLVICYGLDTRK